MAGDEPAGRWAGLCLAGLTGLFVATPLVPSESAASQGTGVVFVLLWLVLLAVWLLAGWRQGGLNVRFGGIDALVLVLVLLHGISALVMAGQGHARPTINMLWQWVGLGISFFLVRQLVNTPTERRALCAVLVALAAGLSAYGFYEYGYSMPQSRAEYQRDPERVLQELGIHAPPGSPQLVHFENRLESKQPTATFALTNSLAAFLAPWLVVVAGIALVTWRTGSWRGHSLPTLVVLGLLIAGCLLLTNSRSAYLAVGLGTVLLAGWTLRGSGRPLGWKIPLLVLAALSLLLLGGVLACGLDRQVLSGAARSFLFRWEYWQATLALIADRPWLGCGPGNFQEYYAAYKLPQASETVADPHNFLLEVGATAGIPALLTLVALLTLFGRHLWQTAAADKNHPLLRPDGPQRPACPTPYIYYGAVAGVLGAYPAGWLVGYLPDPALLLVALPLALLATALLHNWVRHAALPAGVLVVAMAVLLVNLLTTGGIGYAGVAQSGWLLMALALNATAGPPRPLARNASLVLLLLALALIAAFYQTAWNPVIQARSLLAQAASAEVWEQAEAASLLAAQADPYWSEPWQQLAELYHGRWRSDRSPELFQRFQHAVEQALQRHGRSHVVHKRVGDWYLAAYRHSGSLEHLQAAAAAYRQAIQRYPNNNLLHAQLAWTDYLLGNPSAARDRATEALRLDSLMPHEELKLSELKLSDPGPGPEPGPQMPAGPGGQTAEQWMERLRKLEH